MFYYKKQPDKEGNVNIDLSLEHSTLDVHLMRDPETASSECNKCHKPFKNSERCGIVSIGGKMVVEHERCPT